MAANSNAQGNLGEAKVIAYFIENGYSVFTQFATASPIDLVVMKDRRLYRVSVKSAIGKTVELRQRGRKHIKPFDKENQDILAIYIVPEDKVVVLDSSKIDNTRSISINAADAKL